MNKLHAKYIKFVTAGGNLATATEMKLAKDVLGIDGTGEIIEHITSQNPNPEDRTEIGSMFEVRGVLALASQDEFVNVFGGTHNSNVYTKTQGIRVLPDYDVRVAVYRKSDGQLILKDLTNMNFIPELKEAYEQGKQYYLPFTLKSTSDTAYTSDNSAV